MFYPTENPTPLDSPPAPPPQLPEIGRNGIAYDPVGKIINTIPPTLVTTEIKILK